MTKKLLSLTIRKRCSAEGFCNLMYNLFEMVNPVEQIDKNAVKNRKILLHVYNITKHNDFIPFGLGLYHSGVEIYGREYSFGSSCGIFYSTPKLIISDQMNRNGAHSLRESIEMGNFNGSVKDFHEIIQDLSVTFKGSSYNVISRNCNHFSKELLGQLTKGEATMPNYINRLANTGTYAIIIRCVKTLFYSGLIHFNCSFSTYLFTYSPIYAFISQFHIIT